MPELPEIEIVKRSLHKMINNTKIIDVKIKNKKLRYKLSSTFSKQLIGDRNSKIEALFSDKQVETIKIYTALSMQYSKHCGGKGDGKDKDDRGGTGKK